MRRIIAFPLFYTNAATPRLLIRLTQVAHHREGLEAKNGAAIGGRNCSRTDSAGRREPTLQLGSPGNSGTVLGRLPKLIVKTTEPGSFAAF
jgi:hypothetical protein